MTDQLLRYCTCGHLDGDHLIDDTGCTKEVANGPCLCAGFVVGSPPVTDQPRDFLRIDWEVSPPQDVTLSWTPNRIGRGPVESLLLTRKGACEDCGRVWWHKLDAAPVCTGCARSRAYAALPWWRRAFTRNPKP